MSDVSVRWNDGLIFVTDWKANWALIIGVFFN